MNAVNTVRTANEAPGLDHDGECHLCAKNPPFNAKTMAALQEARDIMSGKTKVEWQHPPATKEALKIQLGKMGQE
ncbi:hypothetical protein FACS1894137_14390 [Spirochaetia bacterium]|nr:hypothetical protein FACS1894137_14390 [Spirochaetia bacterium]